MTTPVPGQPSPDPGQTTPNQTPPDSGQPAARTGHELSPPDPGLQPERTSLAWGRTAMALAVVGLLQLRLLAQGYWVVPVLVLVLLIAVVVAGTRMPRLRRSIRGMHHNQVPAPVAQVLLLGAGVLLLGIFSLSATLR